MIVRRLQKLIRALIHGVCWSLFISLGFGQPDRYVIPVRG